MAACLPRDDKNATCIALRGPKHPAYPAGCSLMSTQQRYRWLVLVFSLCYVGTALAGLNDISVPLVGVSLTSLTMAAVGSACAFAWAPTETSRGKLFFVAAASTIVGATAVRVIPHLFHQEWPTELQPPLAFLFGLLAPWVVPAFKNAIPAFFKGLSNLLIRMVGGRLGGSDSYGGGQYGEDQYAPREFPPRQPTEGEE